MEIATRLTAIDRIETNPVLDPRARAYYSEAMGIVRESVTAEAVLAFEREHVQGLKRRFLESLLGPEGESDEVFDYKVRLLDEMKERCERCRAESASAALQGGESPGAKEKLPNG